VKQGDELRIRPGRTRTARSQSAKPFIAQALAAAEKVGGMARRPSSSRQAGAFGRGRAASLSATRGMTNRSRVAVIKARVVRHGMKRAPLSAHLTYLSRHHFRFIVAPEDAAELSDIKAFTHDLMADAERDLGTRLDWVAVDHWNTEHPHVHVLVRGRMDDDQDLVISRDYIREGMRRGHSSS
jgi:hypothetical protein